MSATSKIPSMPNVAFLGLLIFLCLYPGVGTAEQIVDTEPHVVLELGTRGVLPCRIQRKGFSVEWKRQVASESGLILSLNPFSVGKRYGPGYEAGMFNITNDYSLVIKDVKVQDEGIYICVFYDYQTGITFRNSTRVSVQEEEIPTRKMESTTNISNAMAEDTEDHPSSSKTKLYVLEDYNQRIALGIFICIVSLVGTIGNTLVITAVIVSRKLRSSTNWFIVNLACADLLACLSFPFYAVAMLSRDGWPLPDWICATDAAVCFICLNTSVMTLGFIAYNRWYLLTKSKSCFKKLYTTRNLCFMVVIAWVYPSLVVLVPIFAGLGQLGYSYEYKSCTQDTSHPNSDIYSLVAGTGVFIPVFIAVTVSYVRIYLYVSRHIIITDKNKKPEMSNARRKESASVKMGSSETSSLNQAPRSTVQPHVNYHVTVTKRLFIVFLAFFICLSPFGISVMVPRSDPGIPWTGLLVAINSCLNPLIYAWTMPDFRMVMWAIIRCRFRGIPEPVTDSIDTSHTFLE